MGRLLGHMPTPLPHLRPLPQRSHVLFQIRCAKKVGPVGAAPTVKRAGGSELEKQEAVVPHQNRPKHAADESLDLPNHETQRSNHRGVAPTKRAGGSELKKQEALVPHQNRPKHAADKPLDLSSHETQRSNHGAVVCPMEDAAAESPAWTPQLRLSPAGAVPRKSARPPRSPRSPRRSKTIASGATHCLGEPQQRHETDELFLNTCVKCGETRRLPADLGCDFICADAGQQCALCHEDMGKGQASQLHTREECDDKGALRLKLLYRVLDEGMAALESADLLLEHGLDPPRSGELEGIRASLQEKRAQQAAEARVRARQAQDSKSTVRKPQRYLDGKLVEVQKGTRYLVEPKESLEQRQMTSVSIPILGSRAKPIRETTKKKGPQS